MLHSANGSLFCAMVLCAVTLHGCSPLESREDIESAIGAIKHHTEGWMIAFTFIGLLCASLCCLAIYGNSVPKSEEEESELAKLEKERLGALCGGVVYLSGVGFITASLGWGINGGIEAHLRSRTCGNFVLFGADHCSTLQSGKEDIYGWSLSECCVQHACSCDPFSQVQLVSESYTGNDCCIDLESCSSYNRGPGWGKKMPEAYCLESGCTTERCCIPMYTRPCLCNATGEGLHCETGEGQVCGTAADIDSLWSCFTSQTMCVFQHVCHPRPGISGGCQQYKTKESCESQVHCQYEEDTALDEGALQEYCGTVTTKEECDTQQMCLWNSTHTQQSCKNQGQWIGCTDKTETAAARCRSHDRDECVRNSDICNWIGSCECGPFEQLSPKILEKAVRKNLSSSIRKRRKDFAHKSRLTSLFAEALSMHPL